MMRTHAVVAAVAASLTMHLAAGAALPAQQASTLPPIRQITRRLAIAADTFGNVLGIRQLSDGRLIVNDAGKRRLLILDSSLQHASVIADSTGSTQKAYGGAPGGIIAYRGDTTFFVDPIALSLLVIDPHGSIVRTIAPPRPADGAALSMSIANVGVDAAGRLVYRYVRAVCNPAFGCGYAIGGNDPDTAAMRRSSLPPWAWHDSVVSFGERSRRNRSTPRGSSPFPSWAAATPPETRMARSPSRGKCPFPSRWRTSGRSSATAPWRSSAGSTTTSTG